MLARIIPLAVILSLLSAICPAPALATSTATEIQMGQAEDQQIVESSVIETDPLLNAYVQGIAENLWNQVARKDVPYSIKIIKANDVNSFATLGGFVYLYEGLIDFVAVGRRIRQRHRARDRPYRTPPRADRQRESASAQHAVRHRFAILADDLQLRQTRRSRRYGQDLAFRRIASRSLRPAADVARGLRSRMR